MNIYFKFAIIMLVFGILIGFGIGVLAGYKVIESEYEKEYEYIHYLVSRLNEIERRTFN